MKYNPKFHEAVVSDKSLSDIHPNQPEDTVQGVLEIMYELQKDLTEIAGMAGTTLQPVAGAQGEFTGLNIMKAYHKSKGNKHKNVIVLPDSAHGTNPATVTLAGMKVVEIRSNVKGMVDLEELKKVVDENTAGFMLTNPNTLGLFETQIEEIAEIIHSVDGLMYMDGANMNALMGIVKPGHMGFDIMHYNIHKTLAAPHGGGGPGSGPVSVREDLVKYLPYPMVGIRNSECGIMNYELNPPCPAHPYPSEEGNKGGINRYHLNYDHIETSIGKVHSFYGNFATNVKAYLYIKTLGSEGLCDVSKNAIINANYLMKKLVDTYHVPFNHTYCMHEFVASGEWHKNRFGVKTLDIAKRLLDKGFHAPTIYFPLIVHEALMIEPTETESKQTIDAFVDAMLEINNECEQNSGIVLFAPYNTPVRRVDDVKAVKVLDVRYIF